MPTLFSFFVRTTMLGLALTGVTGIGLSYAAETPKQGDIDLNAKGPIKQGTSMKAQAYYHYSLGHMYEEMAGAYGNRSDYVNKAIDNFRLAMKEDPSASFPGGGHRRALQAVRTAPGSRGRSENALKTNPNDLNARRVLAHIYTQQIGDSQANHIDEGMLRRAVEQYKLITRKIRKTWRAWSCWAALSSSWCGFGGCRERLSRRRLSSMRIMKMR